MSESLREALVAVLVVLAVVALLGALVPGALGSIAFNLSRAMSKTAGIGGWERPVASVPWQTIGRSVEQRPILAARFGHGPTRILIVGGVHGNEYGSTVAERFASYLANDPSAVPEGHEVHVIACLNPDGRARGIGPNARGVNLNRNFPTKNWAPSPPKAWGSGRPGSEPETKVLIGYLKKRFDVVVALHSTGPLIDFDGPGARPLAARLSAASKIPFGHMPHGRPMTGSVGVFVPEKYGAPVLTVELGEPVLSPGLRDGLLRLP